MVASISGIYLPYYIISYIGLYYSVLGFSSSSVIVDQYHLLRHYRPTLLLYIRIILWALRCVIVSSIIICLQGLKYIRLIRPGLSFSSPDSSTAHQSMVSVTRRPRCRLLWYPTFQQFSQSRSLRSNKSRFSFSFLFFLSQWVNSPAGLQTLQNTQTLWGVYSSFRCGKLLRLLICL